MRHPEPARANREAARRASRDLRTWTANGARGGARTDRDSARGRVRTVTGFRFRFWSVGRSDVVGRSWSVGRGRAVDRWRSAATSTVDAGRDRRRSAMGIDRRMLASMATTTTTTTTTVDGADDDGARGASTRRAVDDDDDVDDDDERGFERASMGDLTATVRWRRRSRSRAREVVAVAIDRWS